MGAAQSDGVGGARRSAAVSIAALIDDLAARRSQPAAWWHELYDALADAGVRTEAARRVAGAVVSRVAWRVRRAGC